ncbi:MAG TPA: hypothetical protein VMT37_07410 [Solirubrobacterales bacterium]|nr:hypothetical protein [Solirubrobacterales bacterium]
MQRTIRANGPNLLLGLAMAAAAVLILVLTAHLTFFGDCWEFLMNRRHLTADALLEPHNEHIVLIPVLIMQASLRIFGMTSARPEFVLLVVLLLAAAALLYVYLRRRVGPWLALFAAVVVLFLGPAYEVLLWTFELSYVGSIVFGLAMLLALEREDQLGDRLACLFLILCFGFSSVGIAFAVAGAVAIGLGPRSSWRRRAFAVVVPVALFAVWYAGWGHNAESHLSLHNVLASPRYVAESIAVTVGALLGLGTDPTTGSADPVWGRALVVALVVCFGYRAYRQRGIPVGTWPVAAAALVNWFLTAFNFIPGREPTASRYQYLGAFFVLMVIANLLQGVRIGRRTVLAGFAVTALILAGNLVVLKYGKNFFQEQTTLTRSDTAALEIARPTVDPEFALSPEVAGTGALIDVSAARYFEAIDEFGSPAYTQAELETAPPAGRRQADLVLAQALPLSTVIEPGAFAEPGAGCQRLPAGEKPETALAPGTNRIEVAPGGEAKLSLRRFASGEYPVQAEAAPGGSAVELTVPADESPLPWYLMVEASQPAWVCPAG